MADTTTPDEKLEQKLTNDLRHTLKLVPQSQRELFVSELALYFTQYGDTRELEGRIELLNSFEKYVYYGEYDVTEDTTEIGDIVPAWVIRKHKDKLTAIKDNHIVSGPEMVDKETKQ